MSPLDRRDFLRNAALVAALPAVANFAAPRGAASDATKKDDDSSRVPCCCFTESFQDRPIPEVCRLFREIGLDGLDLTVRPGGHIDPKDVAQELPKAMQAARDEGLDIHLLTTGITQPDADAERLIATASKLGIKRFKLGYYRYGDFGSLAKQLDDLRQSIDGVAKLARRYGILPCVHIHSGDTLPSHGTQLYLLLKDFDPKEVGAYVDPMHMTLEGGGDGWRQGLDLLAPWIAVSSAKNFRWETAERDGKGQLRWRVRKVPLADGVAPLPEYVAALTKLGFRGPYTLHSEYQGGGSFKDLSSEECLKQTAEDLKYFRTLL